VQERNIGFVFQHYALFRHMTVLDNVAFGLKVRHSSRRPPRDEIRRRALELLDLVQLPGLEKRYPAQLSGGQRQRVALARAMAVEPNVLLLDEPFGALDAQVRKDLRKWLREIHDRTGHTTVFVTHDQDEAMELADRVVVMSQGAIEQVGTPDEVYDHPELAVRVRLRRSVELSESRFLAVKSGSRIARSASRQRASRMARQASTSARMTSKSATGGGCIAGLLTSSRRVAGTRHVEIDIGNGHPPIELELPPAAAGSLDRSRIAFRPTRWKLFRPA
jgi:sulfate transport system ATP-binding protein